jgi:hypothetical protein
LGHFESRAAIPGTFWNVVLGKDGEDLLDLWYEKLRYEKLRIIKSQRGGISYVQ